MTMNCQRTKLSYIFFKFGEKIRLRICLGLTKHDKKLLVQAVLYYVQKTACEYTTQ